MRLLSVSAGCTIKLSESTIGSYLKSNIVLLRSMIAEGYGDPRTLERRVRNMEKWLENPELLEADADAEYAAIIEIDLAEVTEPVVCAPMTQMTRAYSVRWQAIRSTRSLSVAA